jgi:SAM-dependent methyltransferase
MDAKFLHSAYEYDAATAVRYDAAVPLQDGEVEFYLELAEEAKARGLRTLEPACGTGRVAVPLAQAGIPIVGLDLSAGMLARAREKTKGLDNAEWREGDMRSFDLGEQFGLAFIAVGSLQLLLEVEDQLACLRSVYRHLTPGGRFAFEVENPNIPMMAEWMTARRGTYGRRPQRDFVHPETGRHIVSYGSIEYHPSAQRYTTHGIREELDGDGRVIERVHSSGTLRYFHRYEVEHMLARCGFEVEALYGDLRKGAYRSTSPDLIWVARRPE